MLTDFGGLWAELTRIDGRTVQFRSGSGSGLGCGRIPHVVVHDDGQRDERDRIGKEMYLREEGKNEYRYSN